MIILFTVSILAGVGMLWIFRHTTNQQAIAEVKNKLIAHLYEMRLFTDEPALIWRAQWGLLKANVRYIGLMLIPALVATLPMLLLLEQVDCLYGHEPLKSGNQAVVTLQLAAGESSAVPTLSAPDGVIVESPPVRVDDGRQISWRIRAIHPLAGDLHFVFPSQTVSKSVRVGPAPEYVSERRVSSWLSWVRFPAERPLAPGSVDWIEIRYPPATVGAFGLEFHWLVWFLVISMVSALLLKRQFRVSF